MGDDADAFQVDESGLYSDEKSGLREGWIVHPTRTQALYWHSLDSRSAGLIIIDLPEIRGRMEAHLREWLSGRFPKHKSSHQLFGPNHPVKVTESRVDVPSFVVPLHTRLGVWQFTASLPVREHRTFQGWIIALASFLASGVTSCSVWFLMTQQRLVRIAEQRVAFVNSASHELSCPLTNIRLHVELAQDAISDGRSNVDILDPVLEEVGRLERLVENVLACARLEKRRFFPALLVANLDELIEGVIARFIPSLRRKNVRVERNFHAGKCVLLPVDLLVQVVSNLISNVEKHAATGGLLRVETALSAAGFEVRVSDAGPGVPLVDHSRIFENSRRVPRSCRATLQARALDWRSAGNW